MLQQKREEPWKAGQTGERAPLGILFLLIIGGVMLMWGREKQRSRPLIAFFFGAYLLTLVLLGGWWIYWGELLEPSKWLNF